MLEPLEPGKESYTLRLDIVEPVDLTFRIGPLSTSFIAVEREEATSATTTTGTETQPPTEPSTKTPSTKPSTDTLTEPSTDTSTDRSTDTSTEETPSVDVAGM